MTVVRSRARKQPADVRREEILDAAVAVFAETPFRAAGTAEIARRAGVAEPTLYRHYSSKRELYLAALEECGRAVLDSFRRIATEVPNAAHALLTMGHWYADNLDSDPVNLRLRQRAAAEAEDDEVRALLRGHYQHIVDVIAGVIERGQEQGGIRRDVTPQGGAWMFVAVGLTLDHARMLGYNRTDCSGWLDEMEETVKNALVVNASAARAQMDQYALPFCTCASR